MRFLYYLFLLIALIPLKLDAQHEEGIDSTFYGISASINIDSITISASRAGFNIQDFITFMLEDESFYKAFKNLRSLNYTFDNQLSFYDKKGKEKASYVGTSKQDFKKGCRSMKVLSEDIQGEFFKKGKYRHYTTRLYDRVFITHGVNCSSSNASTEHTPADTEMEQQISMLKKMIFSPGVEADMPLVGEKMAIFSDKMSKYYDYTLKTVEYKEQECYLFSVVVKPEYQQKKKKKTIIKYLNTYFSKEDLQVLSRNYNVKYKNQLYSFDVKIDIQLDKENELYVPVMIDYDGFWDLAFRKPEIAKFKVSLYDF